MPHHGRGGQDHGLAEVAFEPTENRDRPFRRDRARRSPATALETNNDYVAKAIFYQQKYQRVRLLVFANLPAFAVG
jgi:hypothetical protein